MAAAASPASRGNWACALPVAVGIGGPSLAHVFDSVLPLALVALCVVLARCTWERSRRG